MRVDDILSTDRPVFSFEFFPPRTPEGEVQLAETLESLSALRPSYVSVTYGAGGATREGTVEWVTRIRRDHGIEAMAHLSCVGETTERLTEILDQLAEGGIENILALRGDPPRGETEFVAPEGGLSSSPELAAFITERYRFALGGACFPEVHPEAPSLDADLDFLKLKVEAGASFLITQLFFDNRAYFEFVEAARAKGISVPIIPGIIPIASWTQIQRFCSLCEAKIPESLAEQMESLGGNPEAEAELGIAYASRQCDELLAGGAPGIHFYTLNKAAATRAVLCALRAAKPWERAAGRVAVSAPVAPSDRE